MGTQSSLLKVLESLRRLQNLTGGPNGGLHLTDVTNASRTFLMNIETFHWDPILLHTFKIPEEILPEIRSSSEIYGKIFGDDFPLKGVPISGVSDIGIFQCFQTSDSHEMRNLSTMVLEDGLWIL